MDVCEDIETVRYHVGRPKDQMRPSQATLSPARSQLTPPLRPTSSTFLGTSHIRPLMDYSEESQENHCTDVHNHTFYRQSPVQLLKQHINNKTYRSIRNCEDPQFDYIQMTSYPTRTLEEPPNSKQTTTLRRCSKIPADNLFVAKIFLVFGLFLTSLCLPSALVVSKHYLHRRNITQEAVHKGYDDNFHLQVLTSTWSLFPADDVTSTQSTSTPSPHSSYTHTHSPSLNLSTISGQSGLKKLKKNFTNPRDNTHNGSDVTRMNQSRYAILSEPCSFSTCQQRCKDRFGGHLAHVQSIREQVFLEVFVQHSDENLDWVAAYWLGARKKTTSMATCAEGVWHWVDGEDGVVSQVQGWTAFVPGRPDNFNGNEDCLVMSRRNGLQDNKYLKWEDVPCNANFDIYGPIKGICEVDIKN